ATVLLSGNATCDRFAGASGMGIDAFVSKPFTADELVDGIDIALSRVRSRRDAACAERLIGLLELRERIPTASSTRAVFDEVVNFVGESISADRVTLMMYSECGGELRIAASKGLPPEVKTGMKADSGGSISGYVLRNGSGVVINGSSSGEPEIASRMRFRDHLSSGICVPLRAGDETFGVITAGRCSPSDGFGDSELGLLSSIAGRVASGLEQNNASFA
ncbi:MAG: GAF domain-containing protein, partial [Nitrospirae bacterium]|nr:GAF domain-containing protein [Nitrospirota bacterium]